MAYRLLFQLLLGLILLYVVDSRHFRRNRQSSYGPNNAPTIAFGETIRFHANETHLRFKTNEIFMDSSQCAEARLRVEGKRTRVRLYTCHMKDEGAGCPYVYVYKSVGGASYCHQFYGFYAKSSPYAFYVEFERRPREFRDKETELRVRRRRIGRQATREVANVQFTRIGKCSESCRDSGQDYSTQVPMKRVNSTLKTAINS